MSPDTVLVGLMSFYTVYRSFCELPMVLVKPAGPRLT